MQSNGAFGDVQLHLLNDPRWYVEALLWRSGRTAIHEHSFCGAFCVLVGRSLQARYAFREETRVRDGFRLGVVNLIDTELLEPGAVRTIRSGPEPAHVVVHLEVPTITLVARTINDGLVRPQFGYEPPCVIRHRDECPGSEATTRVRTLGFLFRVEPQFAAEFAERALDQADIEEMHDILSSALLFDAQLFRHLYRRAERRVGAPVHMLKRSLLETQRRLQLSTSLAADEMTWQQRLLIALLVTHTSSFAVVDDLARLLPDDDVPALIAGLLDQAQVLRLNALTMQSLQRLQRALNERQSAGAPEPNGRA